MSKPNLAVQAGEILAAIRREQPLIHLLTNLVTMNEVAQALRALGARPIMAFAHEEAVEIALAARAVVLNLGTPTAERMQVMQNVGRAANAQQIPVVFDPVGVGASAFRTASARALLENVRVQVLRGNAGEMACLVNRAGHLSGVDVGRGAVDGAALAREVAQRWKTIAVVTGQVDYASDGTRVVAVHNGHPFLPQISGTGDIVSAFCGACLAVESEGLVAAASALIFLGLAGERAGASARGPGSFNAALRDELYALDAAILARATRVQWME